MLQAINEPLSAHPRATIDLIINGKSCTMEYDSGAQVSTINHKLWEQLGRPKLKKTENLHVYGKQPIETLGTTELEVTLGKVSKTLPVTVVKTCDTALFGLPWMLAFELPIPDQVSIRLMNTTGDEPKSLTDIENTLKTEFAEVFSDTMGTIKGTEAVIHLKSGTEPKAYPARRVPFPLKQAIESELRRLEKEGVIEKVDPAITPVEWATPTVNVVKDERKVRICGDFRITINPHVIQETFLMPTFEELTAKIAGGQLFTVIDLKDAYLQMEVQEASRQLLVISTHMGYFRYHRLPFGLTSSPAIFQRYMEKLLSGIPNTGVFLDDIIVTGSTLEEHIKNLNEILTRMRNVGLRAKVTKTRFFQQAVNYLGYLIDRNGIHPTEEKVKALKETPSPKDVKELRSFLGAVNFYERFVPQLHGMCADLHRLTGSKCTWRWTSHEEEIFRQVKNILTSEETLVPYQEHLPILVCCDASEKGLGAVLFHQYPDGSEKPVAYASRTLKEVEKRYSSIDKEALALIFGVTKFHHYLYGRSLTKVNDRP